MSPRGPITREARDRFALHLGATDRDAIVGFSAQLRQILVNESASSDPAVARLFPAAHPDDIFRNLEFERTHADPLLADRLEALDIVERTAHAEALTEVELLAWLRSLNALRLVLGTRLDVTEDTTEADFAGNDEAAGAFDLYGYLTWLEAAAVDALSTDLGEPV
jgi:hypothetical protein